MQNTNKQQKAPKTGAASILVHIKEDLENEITTSILVYIKEDLENIKEDLENEITYILENEKEAQMEWELSLELAVSML